MSARRVVTREAAHALIESVRAMIGKPDQEMMLNHRVVLVASITHNSCVAYTEIDQLTLEFEAHIGSDQHVTISTNVRDGDELTTVIQHALSRATPPRPPEVDEEPDPTLPPPTAPIYLPVTLWHAGTEQVMGSFSGDLVARMIAAMTTAGETVHGAPGLSSAGTVVLMQRVRLHSAPEGLLQAWGEDTDCEVTVSSRTPDGKVSGWSGQAHRDWTRLDSEQVTRQAIDIAQRSRGVVRVEPGRYTAILGHAAVGALLAQMRRFFDVGIIGPFGIQLPPMDYEELRMAKSTRLGERVFDPRISLWTDPSDPEGGDYPFTEYGGSPIDKARWVDQGVLRMLAYDGQGVRFPWPPMPTPNILSMSGGTTTIDEMIAQCERGIYVNRLSEVELVDQLSGTMQGTTRDGCFFIQNGKIHSAAANFRFYESPFLKFNNVVALGPAQRVAFGFPPLVLNHAYSAEAKAGMWPTAPIVAPSMMVRDFNFSSLSEAV